MSFRFIL